MDNKEKATIYDFLRMCEYINKNGGAYSVQIDRFCDCVRGDPTIDILNEDILKWCKEHPPKTYKEDFLEKFPNAQVCDYDTPIVCKADVYGTCKCKYPQKISEICYGCWDTSMED